ncbi:MAG TPA: hypothetical protein VGF16_11795 [Bryobacteraceae bacterium]|jgi:hypothetical protein
MAKAPSKRPDAPGGLAGYSGTPLPKKLRIGEGSVVALLHAPDGFNDKLKPLPESVCLQKHAAGAVVILAFMKSTAMLARELPDLVRAMIPGRTLWVIWPKKASGIVTDLSENGIRDMILPVGLVDYKVCAVDETWSGLAFAVRKTKK